MKRKAGGSKGCTPHSPPAQHYVGKSIISAGFVVHGLGRWCLSALSSRPFFHRGPGVFATPGHRLVATGELTSLGLRHGENIPNHPAVVAGTPNTRSGS